MPEEFVRTWDRRNRFVPGQPLRAYLYRTVRNLSLNHLRDDQTRQRLLTDVIIVHSGAVPRATVAPHGHLTGLELGAEITRLIETLAPRRRDALTLSRVNGLSHEEVAAVMGCAPRTVNNHLVAALTVLRHQLSGALVAPLAWMLTSVTQRTYRCPVRSSAHSPSNATVRSWVRCGAPFPRRQRTPMTPRDARAMTRRGNGCRRAFAIPRACRHRTMTNPHRSRCSTRDCRQSDVWIIEHRTPVHPTSRQRGAGVLPQRSRYCSAELERGRPSALVTAARSRVFWWFPVTCRDAGPIPQPDIHA